MQYNYYTCFNTYFNRDKITESDSYSDVEKSHSQTHHQSPFSSIRKTSDKLRRSGSFSNFSYHTSSGIYTYIYLIYMHTYIHTIIKNNKATTIVETIKRTI